MSAFLIANHPALAREIADTMGIRTTAGAIKLFGSFAELVLAVTYAISVAIPANAAFVSDKDNKTILRLIAPKRHGLSDSC